MDYQGPSRRGLKPGQRHSGQFKKGDDPRRVSGQPCHDGMTFARRAREMGPAVLEWFNELWQDETVLLSTRISAAKEILDRGFGKAVSTLDINVSDTRQLNTLTIEELEAIAHGEQPRFPIAVDGEVIDAEFTASPTTVDET